jgi:hypothetical protein
MESDLARTTARISAAASMGELALSQRTSTRMDRFSSLFFAFAVLGMGACAKRAIQYPPSTHGQGFSSQPAPVASNAPPLAPTAILPGPPPAPVTFNELPALSFTKGPSLKLVPVVKSVYEMLALAPDTKSWIASARFTPDGKRKLDGGPRLFTPAFPDGVQIEAWASPSAIYHPDGSRVLVWSDGNGTLAVLDVATGKTVYQRMGAVCEARWDGPDQIVFHESSKNPDARLWRVQISTQHVTPLGGPRVSEDCEANLDGSAWIAHLDEAHVYIDGRTGATLPLQLPAGLRVTLSPGANRYCVGNESGLTCTHLPDGGTEQVWSRPTSEYMDFDPEGEHALIRFVTKPAEGVYDGWGYVDFKARTVRRLTGFRATTGSGFIVHPTGKLISIGSGSGVYVYDMDRGKVRFGAQFDLYSNRVDRNSPRRIVIGTDGVMDEFYVDVP